MLQTGAAPRLYGLCTQLSEPAQSRPAPPAATARAGEKLDFLLYMG